MRFGWYACGVQRYTVLDGVSDPLGEGEIWGLNPQPNHAIANCCCHLASRNEERFCLLPNYFGPCCYCYCSLIWIHWKVVDGGWPNGLMWFKSGWSGTFIGLQGPKRGWRAPTAEYILCFLVFRSICMLKDFDMQPYLSFLVGRLLHLPSAEAVSFRPNAQPRCNQR